MKLPVKPAKIRAPSLPAVLPRKRLLEKIEGNQDKRIVLILGQAAQGKSTLAASCVRHLKIPAAWISIDKDDADPVNLFYALVSSVYSAVRKEDFLCLLDHPSLDLGTGRQTHLYRGWITAILDLLTSPFLIVFDGLEQLPRRSPSFQFLKLFVDAVHSPVRLLITSREAPPFGIEKLRMKQDLILIDNEELAFDLKEVELFFREIRKIKLSVRALRKIHKTTKGWVGGLVLISHLIERIDPEVREVFIAEEIPPVFKGHVFKYFGDEIFSSEPTPIQEFLVKSSIFDTVEPELMDAFLEITDSSSILQDCARKNLFVQVSYLDDGSAIYHYHPLFRDFLKIKFKSDFDASSRKEIYFKAGAACEKKGDWENAVKYYLKARAFSEAASLIQVIGMELVNQGRRRDLARWISLVPPHLTLHDPWLLLYLCMTRRFSHTEENLNALRKALELFEEKKDTGGELLCLALLLEALFLRGRDMCDMDRFIEKAEQYLKKLPQDSYPYEKAMLLLQLPCGYVIRFGKQRKALWAAETAYLLSKQLKILPVRITALLHMILVYVFMGEFTRAEQFYRALERIIARCPYPEFVALQQIHFALLCLWEGNPEEAKKSIALARGLTAKHGLVYLYPITLLCELAVSVCLEDHEAAKKTARHFLRFARSMGALFLEALGNLFLGSSYYRNQEYEKAKELAEKAAGVFSSHQAKSVEYFHESLILLGYISYHLDLNGDATRKLKDALEYFSRLPNPLFMADANFSLALLNEKQGKPAAAARHLADGFKIASEKGYHFFLEASRKDLVEVCLLTIKLNVEEAMPYASYLLTTHLRPTAREELAKLCRGRSSKLRKKAKELYTVVHRSELPRVFIRTLGGFGVKKGEKFLSKREWRGKQPVKLLKAMIVNGTRGVRKETLCEILWPDSNPRSVERTFKVALHRLRTSLEPQADPIVGFSYVHLEGNRVSLDEELCEVDADTFLDLARKGSLEEYNGSEKKALSLYDKAIATYGGDFLPGDIFTPWTENKREELKRRYVDVLLRAARICENRGSSRKAMDYYQRVIDSDPVCEIAYRKLMILYSNRGEKNEAIRIYKRCQQALKASLGTKPGYITTSLYKKLLD